MRFTKAANMGLHVMGYFAQNDQSDSNLSIHDLADKFEVSPSYLSKILTQLAKANLISSVSGVKGGYRLKMSPAEISFLDVIHAIDGFPDEISCLANNQHSCPISQIINEGEDKMWAHFASVKLSQLSTL
ncbi:Rrf2 family transcriptional regulator [Enterococcus sp. DIV0756]|uniref:Rrf2 family transcriptional regulator n=1 Tax=Enterococcus sp. DIV0756 TaxID=2774636 RepID=UPI003F23D08A